MINYTPNRDSAVTAVPYFGSALSLFGMESAISYTSSSLDNLARLLESLPLTTEQYGVARNRITNAQRYVRSGERGAARYELQMMLRALRVVFEDWEIQAPVDVFATRCDGDVRRRGSVSEEAEPARTEGAPKRT